ncbi:MAG: ATP synthase F1 subunit gamma [Candidatus Komeilibacteria bacterium]|jgi:F-type H+-transporting ATPase subunit gamma|nr:ATP synthase F1 subunit gamma [Candidatus Komeilibacteria bacterium]MBT4447267.1 ATP synthase F1 subunit gamma [Candidatus Komeilibacteria bacterium]
MPQASRDIQRRIKSVKNTKKITKAMELVSAAKMRKAVSRVLATRSYSDLVWDTVLHLVKKLDTDKHLFFQEPKEVKKVAVIIISTNRGLCGSFNATLVNKVTESIKLHHPDVIDTDVITCGTKGRDEIRRRKINLIADFHKEDITASSEDIRPISHMITKDFVAKKYDKIFVAYTDFMSSLKQVPHVKQLLPIVPEIDERLGHINHEKDQVDKISVDNFAEFVFEPGMENVLDAFLPRLVEVQIYQAVLESEASEHSARMFAMRNATDAAGDMIDELTLAYNQARQASITGEIAEIAAGSAALE